MSFSRVLLALGRDSSGDSLESFADRLKPLLPGASFQRTSVAVAAMDDAAVATGADLIVVSAGRDAQRGRRAIADLVMRAPCSVWVAPTGAPLDTTSVLAAVDLTERSADALAVASHLVRMAGGERCYVLHVAPVSQRLAFEDSDPVARARADRALTTFIARVDEEGVEAQPLLMESADPAAAIVRTAQEHATDLIVMATRGRTRLAAALLPSVCHRVLLTSPVSVLAVKHRGARLGLFDAIRDLRFRDRGDVRFN